MLVLNIHSSPVVVHSDFCCDWSTCTQKLWRLYPRGSPWRNCHSQVNTAKFSLIPALGGVVISDQDVRLIWLQFNDMKLWTVILSQWKFFHYFNKQCRSRNKPLIFALLFYLLGSRHGPEFHGDANETPEKGGGVEEHIWGREGVGWIHGWGSPLYPGFSPAGWGTSHQQQGHRSVSPESALTCGATATKPTVSQQRSATPSTL